MNFRKNISVCFILIVLSGFSHSINGQTVSSGFLTMDGLVYGYNYEPSKKLLQKEKQLKVEGVLDRVEINVLENGKVIKSTRTKSNGTFSLQMKMDKVYKLELSKVGYSPILLIVDLTNVSKELAIKGVSFTGVELILNSYQSKNKEETNIVFGKLFYNTRGNFIDFESTKFLTKRQREYINNPVSLINRSVQKNKNKTKIDPVGEEIPQKVKPIVKEAEEIALVLPAMNNNYDSIEKLISDFKHKTKIDPENITDFDIQSLENDIQEARAQYEKDKLNVQSPEDSLLLIEQGNVLNSIELELFSAKKIISLQKDEISTHKKLLFFAVSFVLLLLFMLFFIFRFNKEKKKTYLLLKDKNKKITDSISYASRIQESILPSDREVKKQLPRSFIYFQPRDVVSGDFYWLSSIGDLTIIACVDCTGHGVPGAFMSLIGNTLLNEIVNEKGITDPSLILKHLHHEIVKSLHQNTDRVQSKDGMEISLCVIDNKLQTIEYAGAMQPIYIVKDNVVTLIKPDMKGIGGETISGVEIEFTKQTIQIEKNMSVYLFTDGYMDQFGGAENKKFNIPNFKKLLLEIQLMDMDKQKELVALTIQNWKRDYRQIDDMLVIGIGF